MNGLLFATIGKQFPLGTEQTIRWTVSFQNSCKYEFVLPSTVHCTKREKHCLHSNHTLEHGQSLKTGYRLKRPIQRVMLSETEIYIFKLIRNFSNYDLGHSKADLIHD